MGGKMRKGAVGVGLALGALFWAPSALASTVTVAGGNTLRVTESGNEVNDITVGYASGTDAYTVKDAAANLIPSGACTPVDSHTATCPGASVKAITVDTDAMNDRIATDSTIPATVSVSLDGGGGSDVVSGHGTLDGGSGDDQLTGSLGADILRGSSGRDLLDGGLGPDDIAGGSGFDTLRYPDRTTPVNVTVGSGSNNDGGLEDQGAGKRDNVHGDVEAVIGTPQNDVLVGDSSGETLDGGAGNDVLIGNNGSDTLIGLDGADLLFGGGGNDALLGLFGPDSLFGGPGNDRLSGGPDDDFLVGGSGSDRLKGKSGIDQLRARDGIRDVKINCGSGSNKAESATRDRHLDPRARGC
jgi:Ca2+-binding RTX toxin-like protein